MDPEKFLSGRGSIVARLRRASEGTATRSTLFAFRRGGGVFTVRPLPPKLQKILVEG
jgi:hypothetical protein